jgi:nitrogenase molybdenum-cofactor synthesis protein NifE
MEGLYKALPPFAPDYSGVCSALFELGGILVVHDGGGCTGNFTGYDEPRWYGSSCAVFSSGLREIDAVVGDDEKLLRKLENAIHDVGGHFVAIIGSPAPMVIGTDYAALARLLSNKLNLPVLTFDTKGLAYYDVGASMAFLEMARNFVKPASSHAEAGVNIIGATPLDIGTARQLSALTTLLTDAGCRIVSCWGMDSTLDSIAQAAQAELNIVVSHAGLEAARYMEREHGVSYLAAIPIGRAPSLAFISSVCLSLGLGCKEHSVPAAVPRTRRGIRKALIIGEQLMAGSIRNCLRMDLGFDQVTVASFFGMDKALLERGDVFLSGEDALTDLINEHHYELIVGDSLYQELIDPSANCRFIPFPHIAVSSRILWDKGFDYVGEPGLLYFGSRLNELEA